MTFRLAVFAQELLDGIQKVTQIPVEKSNLSLRKDCNVKRHSLPFGVLFDVFMPLFPNLFCLGTLQCKMAIIDQGIRELAIIPSASPLRQFHRSLETRRNIKQQLFFITIPEALVLCPDEGYTLHRRTSCPEDLPFKIMRLWLGVPPR
jgi:hypothetical protein